MIHSFARKFKKVAALLIVCAIALAAGLTGGSEATAEPQFSAQTVYLQLDGISGESITRGYEKWISVEDVAFNIVSVGTASSSAASPSGKTMFEDIKFAKRTDAASLGMMSAAITGKHLKTAKFAFTNEATKGAPLTIELTDVTVKSYSFADGVESYSLGYGTILYSYSQTSKDGTLLPPLQFGWDLRKGTKIAG
ncbi:Hcp family type VI secretion system effector [Paenibacillus glycinis]|uniref:Type VI secretion system tube protein Hcp n=1 Tax=Paenibacillus glycinis TaxID=2697035 RepID=A0ABW9XWU6_9BACL|nr:type VI secretion system tube protein Hcp [Paenibacillus glycinis]NBD27189.1 hypothetical protein [Paenibacillus glycinis]